VTAEGEAWPTEVQELEERQRRLAELEPSPWRPGERLVVAGLFAASATGLVGAGAAGDPLWVGAAVVDTAEASRPLELTVTPGRAGGPYVAGLLSLREGPLLERAARALTVRPDVLLVDGTGRDHPRRAGLAIHLGAVLDLPTVGVTVRPLVAAPVEPPPERGSAAPLVLDGEVVGHAVRTRRGARPVLAHAGWRTSPDVALEVVLAVAAGRSRTPEPIRLARRAAREARGGRPSVTGRLR
jgi:deoxyribonuclease V